MAKVERTVASKNCVTIFGGGIAGLTAAHELVERGFRVQLWEPRPDPRQPGRGAELGGMARTQWVAVNWKGERDTSDFEAVADDWTARETHEIRQLPERLFLAEDDTLLDVALGEVGKAYTPDVLSDLIQKLKDTPRIDYVYCEVFNRRIRDHQRTESPEERLKMSQEILKQLKCKLGDGAEFIGDPTQHPDYPELMRLELEFDERKVEVVIAHLDEYPDSFPDVKEADSVISFRVRERWIPGEHGFRFFPAFYHHVFDTMRRTPILEPVNKSTLGASQERSVTVNPNPERYTESGRTVFDNLKPTTKLAFGFEGAGRWPTEFGRSVPKTFEELLQWIKLAYEGGPDQPRGEQIRGLGFTVRDTTRFQLKLVQFLTSCEERRREYEEMSWFEFLGGKENFSENFNTVISDWPEALVAMRADEADARTHGSVLIQLVLDNLRDTGYRDGTLNGPTSEAWIKHWKRYLEAQGVEFIHGKLTGFRTATDPDGNEIVWPTVACFEPRYAKEHEDPPLLPGYFVLALPARQAMEMARAYERAIGAEASARHVDLKRLAYQQAFGEPEDLKKSKPDGQLRHMVGIQYYFDEDISWLDGHAYFPGSPFGLSSISQVRFWEERHDWEHGYRGVLSVVVSVFNKNYKDYAETFELPPDELAKVVWEYISNSVRTTTRFEPDRQLNRQAPVDGNVRLPTPRYWHIDDDFEWSEANQRYENHSPYQINLVGTWRQRPGDLYPGSKEDNRVPAALYSVKDGIVCAGTHMKTFTRLTTMEAANESGRHAVNSILKDVAAAESSHSSGDRSPTRLSLCEIFPIEDREVEDFKALKELDAELYARGLDHFMEILGLDELVTDGFRGGPTDPFDLSVAIRRLRLLFGRMGDDIQVRRDGRG